MPTCFESLARQRGVEVALLDASGDARVAELADRFAGLFAYRRHGPDEGQSDAIIEGWNNAKGDILGWLNADDFLFPSAIERVRAAFAAEPAIDVVAGHSAICDEQGRMTGYHWAVAPPGDNLRAGCVISQPSCFFRRSAYERAGGLDKALHYTMDWDLWLRLLASDARFSFIDEALSVVYWGEGTKTLGMKPKRRAELLRLIETHTPPKDRFRAKRGFLLRAMLDEMKPASLSRFIERGLRRKTPYVFGIGPQGVMSDEAMIYWPRYGETGARELAITVNPADRITALPDDPKAEVAYVSNEIRIKYPAAIAPGETAIVKLDNQSGRGARFIRCEWR